VPMVFENASLSSTITQYSDDNPGHAIGFH
jgi:hypothetical protein